MTETSHPLFARLYDAAMAPVERTVLAEHRRYLTADVTGSVLDLGAGTGRLFPYIDSDANVSLHALEPDPHMRRQAADRARDLGIDVALIDAGAEAMPLADDAMDVVIASLVFCTIRDVDAALSEVARVLKPGGEFRFLEHVRGEGTLGAIHDLATPGWRRVAGGCHLNRETDALLRSDERFVLRDYSRIESPLPDVLPLVRGRLERRRSASTIGRLLEGGSR